LKTRHISPFKLVPDVPVDNKGKGMAGRSQNRSDAVYGGTGYRFILGSGCAAIPGQVMILFFS
jgi:hypothetical protein